VPDRDFKEKWFIPDEAKGLEALAYMIGIFRDGFLLKEREGSSSLILSEAIDAKYANQGGGKHGWPDSNFYSDFKAAARNLGYDHDNINFEPQEQISYYTYKIESGSMTKSVTI
jgi:hypothetical protein